MGDGHKHGDDGDVVEIAGLEVSCIVGVYPAERDTPQPLVVDLALGLDTRIAAAREELSATVDYGRLAGDMRFLLERCRFALIETAAEVLARYALLAPLFERPLVTHARVRIQKPRALTGGAVASVTLQRTPADCPTESIATTWGAVDRIFVGRDCTIERRRISAGRALGPFTHAVGEAHELLITPDVHSAGRTMPIGSAFAYGAGRARVYEASTVEQALLCVRPQGGVDDLAVAADADLSLPRASLYNAPGALSRSAQVKASG